MIWPNSFESTPELWFNVIVLKEATRTTSYAGISILVSIAQLPEKYRNIFVLLNKCQYYVF